MSNVPNPVIAEQLSEAERELVPVLSCSLRTVRYLSTGCQPCTALPSDPIIPSPAGGVNEARVQGSHSLKSR